MQDIVLHNPGGFLWEVILGSVFLQLRTFFDMIYYQRGFRQLLFHAFTPTISSKCC